MADHSAKALVRGTGILIPTLIDADPDVQPECQRAVEAAINQLPDPQQRDSLCLILNRYSAFCASPYTAIDAFPLTSVGTLNCTTFTSH